MPEQKGQYPNSFYRVSTKAIIRNSKDEVLVVREYGGGWCFPGGGIDHGESEYEGLKRELYEEARIDQEFEYKPLGVDSWYLPKHRSWYMWLVYEVILPEGFHYEAGDEVTDIAFKDPHEFKTHDDKFSQLIYEWAVNKTPR
jgi:8-oxo-dGTP pyrophosphatase MutT (NUDIX family)